VGSRAGIVVTGTEVLTGRVTDRNGPWLADQLRIVGVDIADIVVVGDRPQDLHDALAFLAGAGVDLIITSGGLGPTADDLTAEVVGRFQGRESHVDVELEKQIADIVARLSAGRGWRLDPDATAFATRKQALVPDGANVLTPVGTAPGLVVAPGVGHSGPPVLVLPGPPRELQGMWPAALADPIVTAALAGRVELRQRTIRLWGTPESELARVLREHDGELDGLEITTCLSDGELEIVTRYAAEAESTYDALTPGSSAYVLGGLVTYSNEAKHNLAGVPMELIDRLGAVSAEVAEAMAQGARERLGADIGVGITGVAGPDGGTPDKPVGLVHLCVVSAGRTIPRRINVPGSRADVRHRTVVVAMHMLRDLLT
jgi:nicotinamide-nucleotide amidase